MAWDPQQYELFQAARMRPGHDLIAALPTLHPDTIADLGCGTGRLTRMLADRWPSATVIGLDNSEPMLAKAAQEQTRVAWELGDIATWTPPRPLDLVFSNAALQWLPGHEELFPRLVGMLKPGGVLAVQMPRNYGAPSHRIMGEMAINGQWAGKLAGVLRSDPVHPPQWYWRTLAPLASNVEVWETEYMHALQGENPVLEWIKGTGLLPVLEALTEGERAGFLAEYGALLKRAYPAESNGRTLFPFRRLFMVVRV